MTATANRPHYHVWRLAEGDRIFYLCKKGFHTRQAARQWAKRREVEDERYMVRQCYRTRCAPPLD